MTVNGVTCTLGSPCTIPAGGSAYANAVVTCGVDNTGATDVTTATGLANLNTCLATYGSVSLPPGTYKIATAANCITIPSHGSLLGSGVGNTIINNTTSTGNSVCFTNDTSMYAGHFTVTYTGATPSAGAGVAAGFTGQAVSHVVIDHVTVTNAYFGFSLASTDYSICSFCIAQSNYANGFNLFNSITYPTMQWGLQNCLSQFNNGWGYSTIAAANSGGATIGQSWINVGAFANTAGGMLFFANTGSTMNDVILIGSGAGSDGSAGEFYMDAKGGINNSIEGGLFELAGMVATGRGQATAPSHTGNGITLAGTTAQMIIRGAIIDSNANAGIYIGGSGENIVISGNEILNNSQASPGTSAGITNADTTVQLNISNNIFSNNGQTTAIYTTSGTASIIGNIGTGTCTTAGTTLKPSGTAAAYNTLTGCP